LKDNMSFQISLAEDYATEDLMARNAVKRTILGIVLNPLRSFAAALLRSPAYLHNVQIVFAVPLAHDHQRFAIWGPVRRRDTRKRLVSWGKSACYERRTPAQSLVEE
jgi:hypothetical protein